MKNKLILVKLSIFLILGSFMLTGADCAKLLEADGVLSGTWELVKMEGDLQDVCLGEVAQFQSGTATLQCPGQSSVTRSYTFTNNVLTYTSSGVSYDVTDDTSGSTEKLIMRARGLQRVLTYNKTSN